MAVGFACVARLTSDPYRLCFWPCRPRPLLDDGIVGSGTDGNRLLDQAVEELPSVLRGASIETKGKFVQVGVEVLTTDGPLVGSQQPRAQKRRDTMNPLEEVSRSPSCGPSTMRRVWR